MNLSRGLLFSSLCLSPRLGLGHGHGLHSVLSHVMTSAKDSDHGHGKG